MASFFTHRSRLIPSAGSSRRRLWDHSRVAAAGVPDAKLLPGVEHGAGRARHSLPAAAQQIERGRLALQKVAGRLAKKRRRKDIEIIG